MSTKEFQGHLPIGNFLEMKSLPEWNNLGHSNSFLPCHLQKCIGLKLLHQFFTLLEKKIVYEYAWEEDQDKIKIEVEGKLTLIPLPEYKAKKWRHKTKITFF